MRVGFDVDGVLADFTWSFSTLAYAIEVKENLYREIYNKPTTKEVWITKNSEQQTWRFAWDNKFYSQVWDAVDDSYNWWMGLEPLVTEEEINAINYLIKNHDVFFITNRKRTKGYSAETQTRLWLQSIGLLADHSTVIATNSSKGLLCSALDIETFIDDKPTNVIEIREDSPNTTSCVIRRKYNSGIHDVEYHPVFDTVKDYAEWIIELSRLSEKN